MAEVREKIIIPESAVPIKKGMATKEVYFDTTSKAEVSTSQRSIDIATDSNKLKLQASYSGKILTLLEVVTTGNASSTYIYDFRTGTSNKVKVTFDEQIIINHNTTNNSIYCIPEMPEIPIIDTLPDETNLIESVNYVSKVKDNIDICKNKLSYILNEKGVTTTSTDKMSILIDKVNEINIGVSSEPLNINIDFNDFPTLIYSVVNMDKKRELRHFLEFNVADNRAGYSTFREITKDISQESDSTFSVDLLKYSGSTPTPPHKLLVCYKDSCSDIIEFFSSGGGSSSN